MLLMAMRDVRVRYKQAALGAAWAVIQPVTTMVVLHLFFGRLLDMEDRVTVPYPIFLYAGLLPWQLFANGVTASANSLVANASIVRKVYFPRLIVPISAVGAPVVDFLIASVVLLGMMLWFGVAWTPGLLLTPLLMASTLVAVLGVGVFVSAITVSYRDARHLLPFVVQLLFFLTPVIYPVSIVPERFHPLLAMNPMHGCIEAWRAVVLGTPLDWTSWAVSMGVATVMLVTGLLYFQRVESRFADTV